MPWPKRGGNLVLLAGTSPMSLTRQIWGSLSSSYTCSWTSMRWDHTCLFFIFTYKQMFFHCSYNTHTHTQTLLITLFLFMLSSMPLKPLLKKERSWHFPNFREALLILPFLLSKQADCTNWSRASLNALTFLQCYGVPPTALAREISTGNVTILPLLCPSFHIPPEDRYIEPTNLTCISN